MMHLHFNKAVEGFKRFFVEEEEGFKRFFVDGKKKQRMAIVPSMCYNSDHDC